MLLALKKERIFPRSGQKVTVFSRKMRLSRAFTNEVFWVGLCVSGIKVMFVVTFEKDLAFIIKISHQSFKGRIFTGKAVVRFRTTNDELAVCLCLSCIFFSPSTNSSSRECFFARAFSEKLIHDQSENNLCQSETQYFGNDFTFFFFLCTDVSFLSFHVASYSLKKEAFPRSGLFYLTFTYTCCISVVYPCVRPKLKL